MTLRQQFLAGMSFAACTVNIVTTDGPAGRYGLTVSAMTSVSADTATPTLLICVNSNSAAAQAIIDNGVFCVNVLRDDQFYISECFASRVKTEDGDKFSCGDWGRGATGAPRLIDSLVTFECRVMSSQRVGSHLVVFGSVDTIFSADEGSPLIYAKRAYGTASPIDIRPRGEIAATTLRLGAFHTFGPYVIPGIVESLAAEEGGVTLELVEGDQRRVLDSLRNGDVDVALVYDIAVGKGFHIERLAALSPYVLLPERHPLANHAAVSLVDLVDEPLILLDAPPSGDYFLSLFTEQNLSPNVRFRISSFEMVRGMVGRGLGYALLATKPASGLSYEGRALTARPLTDETEPSHIALVTRHGDAPKPAVKAFAERCRLLFAAG
ncbi:LysR substrate-binding domain-containing protein [Ancylobacter mangrovi]|uniref:LysR substrate-binding domain-containing protein n=1 Tax=Ancylobacter mangrovi TaxID=2972472 RepID=UPI002162ACF1|nr:LysR substrate-binding domain-containing protein [Ancylobacter mangrovi]MCS0503168.1 LysR substrate-binding domain-containing protein [Ancylobacter mangrovi]